MNSTLSDGTKIPLKTAFPVIATVIAATMWITNAISGIATDQRVSNVNQDHLRESVGELKLDMQEMRILVRDNRWTKSEMEQWVRRFAKENPGVNVPSVE